MQRKDWSIRGKVLRQVAPRSYLVKTVDGAVLRRNRRDLLEDTAMKTNIVQMTPCVPMVRRQEVKKPSRLIEEMK